VTGGRLGIAALLIAANADPDMENCGTDSEDWSWSEGSDEEDEETDGPVESSPGETDVPVENNPDETAEQEIAGKTPRQLAAGDDKVK